MNWLWKLSAIAGFWFIMLSKSAVVFISLVYDSLKRVSWLSTLRNDRHSYEKEVLNCAILK